MTMTDNNTVYFTEHNLHNSRAIIESWHDGQNDLLFVQFPSGQIAGYADFDKIEYDNFINARSVGRYYSNFVKNHYRGINTSGVEFIKREVREPGTVRSESVEPYVEIKTEPRNETVFVVNLLSPVAARYVATSPQQAAEFATKDYPGAEVTSVEWKP